MNANCQRNNYTAIISCKTFTSFLSYLLTVNNKKYKIIHYLFFINLVTYNQTCLA